VNKPESESGGRDFVTVMKEGATMRTSHFLFAVATTLALSIHSSAHAAEPASAPERAIQAAAQDGKLTYLLFYRDADAATNAMFAAVKVATEQHPDTTWATVQIGDPAQRTVAERFKVTRAPMPMVVALHPNGAVTGAFPARVTPEALAQCIVSPKKAECMAALQQDQLVLICLQTQADQPLPSGVREWIADAHFAQRTRVVTLATKDLAEAGFLASMQVDPEQSAPATVFLAPPGVMVGKFTAVATKQQMAAKLAEAGKCCEDENCKHNQQSTRGAATPGKVTR
jgi:hypothetical protein